MSRLPIENKINFKLDFNSIFNFNFESYPINLKKHSEDGNSNKKVKIIPIFSRILKYLRGVDVINLKCCSKKINDYVCSKTTNEYLKQNIEIFLKKMDKYLWNKFVNYKFNFSQGHVQTKLNCENSRTSHAIHDYENVLERVDLIKLSKESNPVKKSFDDISRDIGRTFKSTKNEIEIQNQKDSSLEMKLGRVLEALSCSKSEVGYCQGMNFIAGSLLLLSSNEEMAYRIFLTFLNEYEMAAVFTKNMSDYAVRVFQLNFYVRKRLPTLYHHFIKSRIPFDLIYSKWLISLFSQYLSEEYLVIDGWKGIIKASLILLEDMQPHVICMDIDSFCEFLRGDYMSFHRPVSEFIAAYSLSKCKVTRGSLNKLRHEYYVSLANQKLLSHSQSQVKLPEIEAFIMERNRVSRPTRGDIKGYQTALEVIEKCLKTAQTEYNQTSLKCNRAKAKLQILVERKNEYEIILSYLDKELGNTFLTEKLNEIKGQKINFGSEENLGKVKSKLITEEIIKLRRKIKSNETEINEANVMLLQSYDLLEEKKYLMEKLEKEKKKKTDLLQKYLTLLVRKEEESIKRLGIKLKYLNII